MAGVLGVESSDWRATPVSRRRDSLSMAGAALPLVFLAQLREHAVILQRRCIAGRLLAAGDVAEQAAHDLAGARFRQSLGEADLVWAGQRPDLLGDVRGQLLLQFLRRRVAAAERDEADDALAL